MSTDQDRTGSRGAGRGARRSGSGSTAPRHARGLVTQTPAEPDAARDADASASDRDAAEEGGPVAEFSLRILPDDGDAIRGSIARTGERPFIPFQGWMEFMTLVDKLRASPPGPPATDR